MSEEPEKDDFVVIDKRAASAAESSRTGTLRDEASSAPNAPAGGSRESASPARADFATLVQPFLVAALYHLGLAPDPETGQPGPRNLPLARHNIEILEVIAEKTRGNLDDAEQQLIEGVLYELRMSFVKVGKASGE